MKQEENRNVEQIVSAGEVVDFEALHRKVRFSQLRRRAFEAAIREAAAKVDPTVSVDLYLGDRKKPSTFKLEYTLRTCINLWKDIGKNPAQGNITDEDLDNIDLFPRILWHGLQKHHADGPTLDDLLDINARHSGYLKTAVAKAISAILPDEELLKRVELEMMEDDEFRPFVRPNGSTGSSPSGE